MLKSIIIDEKFNGDLNFKNEEENLDLNIIILNGDHNLDLNISNVISQSKITLNLLVLAFENKITLNINAINKEIETTIILNNYGVVGSNGKIIFNTIGQIDNGFIKSTNEQENTILLMDDAKGAQINPILKIRENDVIAGHSANIVKLDKEELYYLLIRGINLKDANKMYISGFINKVLNNFNEKEIQMVKKIIWK